jgi:hypothetical protein
LRECLPIPVPLPQFGSIANMHTDLAAHYADLLAFTLILIPNGMAKTTLNAIIGPLYKPVRPLRFDVEINDHTKRWVAEHSIRGDMALQPLRLTE